MPKSRPFVILMVDDDEDDWMLLRDAFAEGRLTCEVNLDLRHVWDGVDLFEYLDREIEEAPTPHMILLDLNMPRMDGRQTLKRLKSHPAFRSIPVVVFSTSGERSDVVESYQNRGSSFVRKPQTLEGHQKLVESLFNYWICIAERTP